MQLAEEWEHKIPTGILYKANLLPRQQKVLLNENYTLEALRRFH